MEETRKLSPKLSKSKQAVKTEWGSQSVVFTYFQGDINSMVDEHFSRALSNAKNPQDLSTKHKGETVVLKNVDSMSPHQWNFSSHCYRPYPSSSATSMANSALNFSAAGVVGQCQPSSLQSRPAQPADLWPFPPIGTPSVTRKMLSIHARMHHEATLKFCLFDWTCQVTKYESKFSSWGREESKLLPRLRKSQCKSCHCRLPFHKACFALTVQVSDPRKIEQPLHCTSSTHVVTPLQFAPTNPPYCWVFRFMTEDEICTSSNGMFLLCWERESYFCGLLLFATVNQDEMNCSYLSCVFLSAGRIHVLFTVWGMTK
ncbi:PREDICTED: transcription cofactor vestigial-like protein 1 isoform X3 [Corvus brachyrhynchos]|uniref:transcription cofactor vestigial-like protein 1 isoform X3 n=1 Tax=Corvus brachyrhynchos TaxID=85066 RepID=UPI0008167910|nr:PREDICTED: transcription cofactor vestigial-like protein 1 isoform X3 [Corvus brachyrhynchos]